MFFFCLKQLSVDHRTLLARHYRAMQTTSAQVDSLVRKMAEVEKVVGVAHLRETPNEGSFWGNRFLIIVTGASKGIGRAMAIGFSRRVAEGSVIVITGRNRKGLTETKRLVADVASGAKVVVEAYDHSKCTFQEDRDLILRALPHVQDPQSVVLVHNAGSLGDNSKYALSHIDESQIDDYYRLNLRSVMTLTAAFLQQFANKSSCTIVNMTSIGAILPHSGLSMYCSGE